MSWRRNGPQAQPLAPVLLERAMALADTSLSPPGLDLLRIRGEAERLLKSDAAGAHEILGVVACLRQRPTEARHHHQNTIRLDSDDVHVFNYGTSLVRMGCFEEGISQYRKAFDQDPSSIETVQALIEVSLDAGRVTDAERWLEELFKRKPASGAEMAVGVRAVREFLDEHGVDELDVQALVSRCTSALHEKNIWALEVRLRLNDEDGQLIVHFRVPHEADFVDLLESVAISLAEDEIPAEVDGRVVPFFHREHKDENQWPSLQAIS